MPYHIITIIFSSTNQMLFGRIIKQAEPFTFDANLADTEEILSPILAIHNVALGPENKGTTSLWVKKDNKEFLVISLSAEHPHAHLDLHLFIEDETTLLVKGPGAIHVIGSFSGDDEGSEFGDKLYDDLEGEDEDEDEEDEDEDSEEAPVKAVQTKTQPALKHVAPSGDKKSPLAKPQTAAAPTKAPLGKAASPAGSPALGGKSAPVDESDED